MYEICPKCHYQRQSHEQNDPDICRGCDIFFSSWLKAQLSTAEPEIQNSDTQCTSRINILSFLSTWLFNTDDKTSPVIFCGRVMLFVGLLFCSWKFIQMDFVLNPFQNSRSYMHNIDLIFHEAGHILFMPIGRFMTILGGSLFQLINASYRDVDVFNKKQESLRRLRRSLVDGSKSDGFGALYR